MVKTILPASPGDGIVDIFPMKFDLTEDRACTLDRTQASFSFV